MKPVIQVKNLSKVYNIGHEDRPKAGTVTFRDTLSNFAKKPLELLTGHRLAQEKFWALEGVSFDVNQGDILGIIGRNGSGKSTLLKILSRITEPTEGEIHMRGKVASLLEVGTGFHPELTGRENIYFNGSILGMSRSEIENKFMEIVDFSEIEQFLDTPVKFYSSGMYVRLAFAVAAHLEPDILIVDEVLAVGDGAFQKKCLGKMNNVAQEGRTVLFVSHNMSILQSICNRALLLEKGVVKFHGNTREVLDKYLNESIKRKSSVTFADSKPGNDIVRLLGSSLKKINGKIASDFDILDPITIELTVEVLDENVALTPNIHLRNGENEVLFVSSDQTSVLGKDQLHPKGVYQKQCIIPPNLLNCGTYYIGVAMSTMEPTKGHFFEQDLLAFTVSEDMSKSSLTARGNYIGEQPGDIRPVLEWRSVKK